MYVNAPTDRSRRATLWIFECGARIMKANISGRLRLPLARELSGPAAPPRFWRRWRQPRTAHLESKADITSWENEGGNLAPATR